jgi:hypothetical protein
VNEDGSIRLQEEVDLPTGGEVLVTFLDKDAFVSLLVSTGTAGYSEERLRAEIEEDEYWAEVYKDLLSS